MSASKVVGIVCVNLWTYKLHKVLNRDTNKTEITQSSSE